MAGLLPINSFARDKRTSAPPAPAGSGARFAALDYVKSLDKAPDGSRITSTENNVLMQLAQLFNSEMGVAWPSMKELARRAHISERHCRRTVESLERKKIIQRVHMRRKVGGQASNEYFFPELGAPPQTPLARARRLELQKVARTPMSGTRGRIRPAGADTSVRPARTQTTGGPGHGCPPIESLGEFVREKLGDSSSEALVLRSLLVKPLRAESPKTSPKKTKAFSDLKLAQKAWESAIKAVCVVNDARELRSFRFRDVTPVSAEVDRAGAIRLTLCSPAPEKAKAGIAKHEPCIARALIAFYGCKVRVRVIGPESVRGEPPAYSATDEAVLPANNGHGG